MPIALDENALFLKNTKAIIVTGDVTGEAVVDSTGAAELTLTATEEIKEPDGVIPRHLTLTDFKATTSYSDVAYFDGALWESDGTVGHADNEGDDIDTVVTDDNRLFTRQRIAYLDTEVASAKARLDTVEGTTSTLSTTTATHTGRLDALDAAVGAGAGTPYETVAALPATDGSGRTAYVYNDGANNGYYADLAGGWTRIFSSLPADFDPRLDFVEGAVDNGLHGNPLAGYFTVNPQNGAVALADDRPGWTAPAGTTAQGTSIDFRGAFLGPDVSIAASLGVPAEIVFICRSSDDFLDDITHDTDNGVRFTPTLVQFDGVSATIPSSDRIYRQPDTNTFVFGVKHTFTGTEQRLRFLASVGSNQPFAADAELEVLGVCIKLPVPDPLVDSVSRNYPADADALRTIYMSSFSNDGATRENDQRELLFPAGQRGREAALSFEISRFNLPDGTKVRVTAAYETTPGFQDETELQSLVSIRAREHRFGNSVSRTLDLQDQISTSDRVEVFGIATLQPDDSDFYVTLKAAPDASARTTDGLVKIVGVTVEVLEAPDGYDASALIAEYKDASRRNVQWRRNPSKTVLVSPDAAVTGQAGYATLREAVNSENGGIDRDTPALYRLQPGHYANELSVNSLPVKCDMPQYSLVVNDTHADNVVFAFVSPDGTPDQKEYDGFLVQHETQLENLTIFVHNNRYGIHPEIAGVADVRPYEFFNLRIVHYGRSDGGAPTAIGVGGHDGSRGKYHWIRALAPKQCVGIHDNVHFREPQRYHFEGCQFTVQEDTGNAMGFPSLGAGSVSSLFFDANAFHAPMQFSAAANLSDRRDDYLTRAVCVQAFNKGRPFGWFDGGGQYLALTFTDTARVGSYSRMGGTAGASLFEGAQCIPGGVGFPSKLHALRPCEKLANDAIDGSELLLSTLLGDRTGDPWDLVVTVGFSPLVAEETATLTLDADYSAMTNQQVADDLNTRLNASPLAAAGRAFSIETGFKQAANVKQPAGEWALPNGEAFYMQKGLVAVMDGTSCRLAQSSDIYSRGRHGIIVQGERQNHDVVVQWAGDICQASLAGPSVDLALGTMLGLGPDGTLVTVTDPALCLLTVTRTAGANYDAILLSFNEGAYQGPRFAPQPAIAKTGDPTTDAIIDALVASKVLEAS